MKKLLTVSLLGVLLSIPSVVFAEASWYGSIRTGVESSGDTGVADFTSRWGVQGSSEVSEGLTAVYRYERGLNSTSATDTGGRLSYVGLSGGFGTVTVGQIWGAAYNHFGGIVDQALNYGSPGTTGYRFGNVVSYSVSVGNVSLQADAIMDQAKGKTGDGFNFGATLGGLMETGSVAIAHRKHVDILAADEDDDDFESGTAGQSSTYIAGNYGIGDMTIFLGYSDDKTEVDDTTNDAHIAGIKAKTTFAGVHGGVGDTGVNYVFTMRSNKTTKTTQGDVDTKTKASPWTLGLSRSLGGGATAKFEHHNPDTDGDSTTALWLQVNF